MKWELDLVREWQRETGREDVSPPEVAFWAIRNNKYKSPPADEAARLAKKLSQALRSEHFVDAQGRTPRLMHVVTSRQGQQKMTCWYDMRKASPDFMKRSLQQRREQSLADNYQIKVDCDSYNDNFNEGDQINMIYDYTIDVLELEAARRDKPESA